MAARREGILSNFFFALFSVITCTTTNEFQNKKQKSLKMSIGQRAGAKMNRVQRDLQKPLKMSIAQEVPKGTITEQKPPCFVAKLMGLDALSTQQLAPTVERISPECYKHGYKHSVYRHHMYPSDSSAPTHSYGELEHGYFDKTRHDVHPSQYHLHKECKDDNEIRPQPSRFSHKDHYLLSKSDNEDTNENTMVHGHQKFRYALEALTKEFQDAVNSLLQDAVNSLFQDVVNSLTANTDLFLMSLREHGSLFSSHLQEIRAGPTSPQTKCLHSNVVGYKSGTEIRKVQTLEGELFYKSSPSWSPNSVHLKIDNLFEPT